MSTTMELDKIRLFEDLWDIKDALNNINGGITLVTQTEPDGLYRANVVNQNIDKLLNLIDAIIERHGLDYDD